MPQPQHHARVVTAEIEISPRFSEFELDRLVAFRAGPEAGRAIETAEQLWGPRKEWSPSFENSVVVIVGLTGHWSPESLEAASRYIESCKERFGGEDEALIKTPLLILKLCHEAGVQSYFPYYIDVLTSSVAHGQRPFTHDGAAALGAMLLELARDNEGSPSVAGAFIAGGIALDIEARKRPYSPSEIVSLSAADRRRLEELRKDLNIHISQCEAPKDPEKREAEPLPGAQKAPWPHGLDLHTWGLLEPLVARGAIPFDTTIDAGYVLAAEKLNKLRIDSKGYAIFFNDIIHEIGNFACAREASLSVGEFDALVTVACASLGRGSEAIRLLAAIEKSDERPLLQSEIRRYGPGIASAFGALASLHRNYFSGWGRPDTPESPMVQLEELALTRGAPSPMSLLYLGHSLAAHKLYELPAETARWLHHTANRPELAALNTSDLLVVATDCMLLARDAGIPYNSVGVRVKEAPSEIPALRVTRPILPWQ